MIQLLSGMEINIGLIPTENGTNNKISEQYDKYCSHEKRGGLFKLPFYVSKYPI